MTGVWLEKYKNWTRLFIGEFNVLADKHHGCFLEMKIQVKMWGLSMVIFPTIFFHWTLVLIELVWTASCWSLSGVHLKHLPLIMHLKVDKSSSKQSKHCHYGTLEGHFHLTFSWWTCNHIFTRTFLKTCVLFDFNVFILSAICPWSSSDMAKLCLAFFSDSSSRDFHTLSGVL